MLTNRTFLALAATLALAGSAHAKGAGVTTDNSGLKVTTWDQSSARQGPNESAYQSTVKTKYSVQLPATSPLASANKLRMYVGVNTQLSGAAGKQAGPEVSGWVNLSRNKKTGAMQGTGTMSFVRSEYLADDVATRRAIAVTDGTNWYSNYGKNVDVAAPTIK